MPRQWFIQTKSGPVGPVSTSKLVRLARHGKLTPNMGVSHDGQSWIKAKKISELCFLTTGSEPQSIDAAESIPSSTGDEWYVLTKHSVAGPFTHRKLRKLARRGRIQPNVAVSRDRVKWTKAKRIPGIDFPDSSVNLAADVAEHPVLDVTAPRQRLLFVDGIEFPRIAHQLTLFAVDPERPLQGNDCRPRDVDDWPLFHWPPTFEQLRLFDRTPGNEHRKETTSTAPPRQLEFSLLIGDKPFAEFQRSAGKRQQTLFAYAGRPIDRSRSSQRLDIDHQPLFHWPPGVVQLRLFEHAVVSKNTGVCNGRPIDTSSAPAAPPPEPRESDQTSLTASSAADTERWLHANWDQLRRSEYLRRFGACSHVARPQDSSGVPVDIYVFPATEHRPITTLVTSGMSDCRMPVPQGRCSPRAELVLYVNEIKAEYVNLLYFLAQIPLQQHKALRYGTAISHGNPPRPILPGSMLDGYVFMIPSVPSDFEIHQSTRIGDDSLQLLWVVPTTLAERIFLAKQGMSRFCRLLDQNQHGLAFDPTRRCYVGVGDSVAS